MELQTVNESEFTSIFGNNPNPKVTPQLKESGFTGTNVENSMFTPLKEKEKQEDIKEVPTDKIEEVLENAEGEENENSLFDNKSKEVDIKNFNSVRSIFEELIKNNSLLPLEDEKLDTPEDVQALIQANVVHQVEEFKSNENNAWYASKSPAWRVVAEYSEKVQHPSELLPFIQSVQTIDNISDLDAKNEADAETIVRMALLSRNESQDIIDETISTYKENGKLSNLAEKYQPNLVQQEQVKMEKMIKQKEQDEIDNYNMIKQIHEDAIKVLEQPFMGKHKMKKEEKASIYNMIAAPDEQTGGYKIFTAIDNLYETKDFEKLRKIALILQDENAYNGYLGLDIVKNTAEGLMRKVKTTSTATGNVEYDEPAPVKANQLPRSNYGKDTGFGYFTK